MGGLFVEGGEAQPKAVGSGGPDLNRVEEEVVGHNRQRAREVAAVRLLGRAVVSDATKPDRSVWKDERGKCSVANRI